MTDRPPRWSEVTAFFGGRFDPPHLGHREAALGLLKNPGVREVRILPSPSPPHKSAVASIADRAQMVRMAFPEEIAIDPREIRRAESSPHLPTYTYDTLLELRREVPNLAFVIGADQLEDLHRWHRFPEVLGLSHWIVLARRPDGHERASRVLTQWEASGLVNLANSAWRTRENTYLILVDTDAPAISSTEVREAIAKTGQIPEKTLPEPVLAYLMHHNKIYGNRPPPI